MLNRSRSASVQFRTPSSFLLVSASVFFCFCFQRPSFCFFSTSPFVSFLPAFLFFSVHMCPFFQPKTILSSAQKHFFQPKTFFFSLERFSFGPKPFSVQPTPLFQPLFVLFQPFFFLLVLFSAHLFFLFSTSFSSFFFSASFSFSCQLPWPKIFSLDASHFFYLNKSLFSSNLE